jgi:twinkle protein
MSNYSIGFEELGIDLSKLRNKRKGKTLCPKCSSSRKKSREPILFVNLESGVYYCHNSGCSFSGRVDSDEWISNNRGVERSPTLPSQPVEENYRKPKDNFGPPSKAAIDYLLSRGWTEELIEELKVSSRSFRGVEYVVFRYYLGGELVKAKFRIATDDKNTLLDFPKIKQLPECKPIAYGSDDIVSSSTALICEGEIDLGSWRLAGIKESISLDAGGYKLKDDGTPPEPPFRKFDCLSNISGYLLDKERIYIALDGDDTGRFTTRLLVEKFGVDRCYVVKFPDGEDANSIHKKYGARKLLEYYEDAKRPRIADITKLEDVVDDIIEDLEQGYEEPTESTYVDELAGKFSWIPGFLYGWTGFPNSGKSEYLSFLTMVKSAYDGDKWAVFSPEHSPAKQWFKEILRRLTGKSLLKNTGRQITPEDVRSVKDWVNDHFVFIFPDDTDVNLDNKSAMLTPTWILQRIKELVLTEGITGFIIDPWNQLDHVFQDHKREDLYLSFWLQRFKRTCLNYSLKGNLVVHPPADAGRNKKAPTMYDISGGAMFANKLDVVSIVNRPNFYKDKDCNLVEIDTQKAKQQYRFGIPDKVEFRFNRTTSWYVNSVTGVSALDGVFESISSGKTPTKDPVDFDEKELNDLGIPSFVDPVIRRASDFNNDEDVPF